MHPVTSSTKPARAFTRWAFFAYGILCYALFHLCFAGFVLFTANAFVPKGVDDGTPRSFLLALAINLGLIALFGVQHSLMARPSFKRWWTRLVPQPVERATYVLASNLCLALLCWLWVPMEGTVWSVQDSAARTAIWGLFLLGWLFLVSATFLLDHFELFGLRQVYDFLRGREARDKRFGTPGYYRVVRHPIQTGVFIFLWATPDMSVGHLVLALGMSAYIVVGLWYEERDLMSLFGETYREYQRAVPQLLPWIGWRSGYSGPDGLPPTVPVEVVTRRS